MSKIVGVGEERNHRRGPPPLTIVHKDDERKPVTTGFLRSAYSGAIRKDSCLRSCLPTWDHPDVIGEPLARASQVLKCPDPGFIHVSDQVSRADVCLLGASGHRVAPQSGSAWLTGCLELCG